jgi:hypothetical protein
MAIERYRSGPRPVYGLAAGDRNRPVPVDIESSELGRWELLTL